MQMTKEEVVRSYRQALDKNAQVRVLAELNAVEVNEIVDILTEAGEVTGIKPRAKSASRIKWTDELDNELIRLRDDGESVSGISERLGIGLNAVKARLNKLKKQKCNPDDTADEKYVEVIERKAKELKLENEQLKKEIIETRQRACEAVENQNKIIGELQAQCNAALEEKVVLVRRNEELKRMCECMKSEVAAAKDRIGDSVRVISELKNICVNLCAEVYGGTDDEAC